jgi:hypothetical protein
MIFLPILAAPHRRPSQIYCVMNLKQVALSFRIWEGDNNNKYPMAVSVTNGGAMEWIATNNVTGCFQVMSNELSTPKILICPEDMVHTFAATNFDKGFNASHISYFIGIDASNEDYPQRLLCGDDNFQIKGTMVGSGILSLLTNTPMEWGQGRHGDAHRKFWMPRPKHFVGNLGFADGSVREVGDSGLQADIIKTGLATNRLAIP